MIYIGSSIEANRRWNQHKSSSLNPNDHHYNYPLMKAFREFGFNSFIFEIIETTSDIESMIRIEHEWILKENCIYPNGYNQTDKTDSPMFDPNVAKKMSETKRRKYGKSVCEIDEHNNIIEMWQSIAEAAEKTGLNRYKISNVCNGNRLTTGNRIFRFIDNLGNILEIIKEKKETSNRITKTSRKIAKINLDDEIVAIYDSIALAAKNNACDNSAISAVCRGKRKQTGGFKWKYL